MPSAPAADFGINRRGAANRGAMIKYKHLLMPFIGPTTLGPVLGSALSMARDDGADLHLLRVQPVVDESFSAGEALFTELKGLHAQLQPGQVVAEIELEPEGSAESIVAYAHEHQIDLIMLPRPDSADYHLINLIQDIILQARCPILIIGPDV